MSRNSTESLVEELSEYSIRAVAYHAGLSSDKREKAQDDFINDRVNVVCATVAFGMGIDKSNVRWVIHYNMPTSIENYYQEIGRAGRDGMKSDTLLFYSVGDILLLRRFAEESGQKDVSLQKLNRMRRYCEADICRRRILLSYFGEETDKDCGNCDVCKNPPQRFDGSILVQKALSGIFRTGQTANMHLLIDILRGAEKDELKEKGYDKLKTYGVGKDLSYKEWKEYLYQMLQLGYIEIDYMSAGHLKVTPLGRKVLFGEQENVDWNKADIDWNAIDSQLISRRIAVTRNRVNGVKLGSLRLRNLYGINITRVNRAGIDLLASPDLRLQIGDRLTIVGEANSVNTVGKILGDEIKRLNNPNLLAVFIGISLGMLLGALPITLPGMSTPVKLGIAGGPIIVGILMGAFGPRFHLTTYTTMSANLMLREIGISIFLACVGLGAGEGFVDTVIHGGGYIWVGYGVIITILPLLITGLVGRYYCKLNYFTLIGVLAGSTTNPPALAYSNDLTSCDAPAVGYATVYPLTMFLRVLTAQILILSLG